MLKKSLDINGVREGEAGAKQGPMARMFPMFTIRHALRVSCLVDDTVRQQDGELMSFGSVFKPTKTSPVCHRLRLYTIPTYIDTFSLTLTLTLTLTDAASKVGATLLGPTLRAPYDWT